MKEERGLHAKNKITRGSIARFIYTRRIQSGWLFLRIFMYSLHCRHELMRSCSATRESVRKLNVSLVARKGGMARLGTTHQAIAVL
jgi:hypothetical protein